MAQEEQLEKLALTHLIGPEGPLSLRFEGFESRPQQQAMLEDVANAYNEDQIALIEAGTGTGKSMAYLLPALFWALLRQERTVISTKTISLQQQLLNKDIPAIARALGIEVKSVLVKGMGNYICLRKLEEAIEEIATFEPQQAEELQFIDRWKDQAQEGSRSELPMFPSNESWERVGAEGDACPQRQCPHYERCFFFAARRQANDAQVLVANHALLFSDIRCREENKNYEGTAILPSYKRLILDEAHHIEHLATEHLAEKVSLQQAERLLNRLINETVSSSGRLQILYKKLVEAFPDTREDALLSVFSRLSLDLPAQKRHILWILGDLHEAFAQFISQEQQGDTANDSLQLLRIRQSQRQSLPWKETVLPHISKICEGLKVFLAGIKSMQEDLIDLENKKIQQLSQSLFTDIDALVLRLEGFQSGLEAFATKEESPEEVSWIESIQRKKFNDCVLVTAQLNIAQRLASALFSRFPTTILCSATLATNREFGFVRQRLGLTEAFLGDRVIQEAIYDAPFDYPKQALLAVPNDIPPQGHPQYMAKICESIKQIIRVSRGNAFVLFTSYGMLKKCYDSLEPSLTSERYVLMRQGQCTRQDLLQRFRSTERSVLFGTDSFWEGVDVKGDALRCVIIVKLPFQVPTEPLFQARTEWILEKGGNPFMHYTVPHAIVKFKQGFGRLIRNKKDRGCIVCLDPRLINKPYGSWFINSLPNCNRMAGSMEAILKKMEDFYRRTYPLTL